LPGNWHPSVWVKLLADNYEHAPKMYENLMHLQITTHKLNTTKVHLQERSSVSFSQARMLPGYYASITLEQHGEYAHAHRSEILEIDHDSEGEMEARACASAAMTCTCMAES
jgi:4-alpha-glucanotransferase